MGGVDDIAAVILRQAMRNMLMLLLALGAAACLAPETTGGLNGTIGYREHGPAEDVEVILDANDGSFSDRTQTGAEGSFLFVGLEPGSYRLLVEPGPFAQERQLARSVEVVARQVTTVPAIALGAAGSISGRIELIDGAEGTGFRVQVLGSSLSTVSDARGNFSLHRVPEGTAEIIVERENSGIARRAGIVVAAFGDNDIGTVIVDPDAVTSNRHPRFTSATVLFHNNGTAEQDAVQPLPYNLPPGTVRRFDQILLQATATDPDGDTLQYEWSASAGVLTSALTASPLWQPGPAAGSGATITVTVSDGHGGSARLSGDVAIVNVFSGTAHGYAERIVHSYRIEGGPWQIDLVSLADFTSRPVTTVEQRATPAPLLVGDHVVFREGSDLLARSLNQVDGPSPVVIGSFAPDMHAALPSAVSNGAALFFIDAAEAPSGGIRPQKQVLRWSAATNVLRAFSCADRCVGLGSGGGRIVALMASGTSLSVRVGHGAGQRTVALPTPVGTGLAISAATSAQPLAFVLGQSNRGRRNTITQLTAAGLQSPVYQGFYSLVLWTAQGDHILFTEQEYRALRHPPFVRLTDGRTFAGDDDQEWMADRAYLFETTATRFAGSALVRRITESDWPGAFDASRSEIVLVDLERGFQ